MTEGETAADGDLRHPPCMATFEANRRRFMRLRNSRTRKLPPNKSIYDRSNLRATSCTQTPVVDCATFARPRPMVGGCVCARGRESESER